VLPDREKESIAGRTARSSRIADGTLTELRPSRLLQRGEGRVSRSARCVMHRMRLKVVRLRNAGVAGRMIPPSRSPITPWTNRIVAASGPQPYPAAQPRVLACPKTRSQPKADQGALVMSRRRECRAILAAAAKPTP